MASHKRIREDKLVKKLSVVVLCGGQSTEHAISLRSAHNVVTHLQTKGNDGNPGNQSRYTVQVIYITEQGEWYYIEDTTAFLQHSGAHYPNLFPYLAALKAIKVLIDFPSTLQLVTLQRLHVDCFFPVLHGTNCEDGSMQGLLQLLGVPYVGAGVLSSAICMDKDITKQLLTAHGILVVPWRCVTRECVIKEDKGIANHSVQTELSFALYAELTNAWGQHTLVVKPATLGSSVGLSLVRSAEELLPALLLGFRYDTRLMIEKHIAGREIECAVLGNQDPIASVPGEIILQSAPLYTYEAKYLDPNGATTAVPAVLPDSITEKIRCIAKQVFTILCCTGLLRVDFFITAHEKSGEIEEIYVNEVNTIPGFTNMSLYPQMMQASGVDGAALIDRLIVLAIAQHQRYRMLERVY